MNNIRFKRGNYSNLPPSAPSGTPLYCEDTKELYIGTGDSIIKISGDGSGLSSSAPVGTIISYSATTPPVDYLVCSGGAISRTIYSVLFGVIGTKFGAGDGSTTFNLPLITDGRFVKGSSDVGVTQNSSYPSHSHSYTTPSSKSATTGGGGDHTHAYMYGPNGWSAVTSAGGHSHSYTAPSTGSGTTGASGSGSEVLPKNITLLPCIKYR